MHASTPTTDYVAFRYPTRDCSVSPSFKSPIPGPRRAPNDSHMLLTPSKRPDMTRRPTYDSPMLTPSKRATYNTSELDSDNSPDNFFLQSPFKSPAQAQQNFHYPSTMFKSPREEQGAAWLSASSTQPLLLTPVKQANNRSALSMRQLSAVPHPATATHSPNAGSVLTSVGVKRKSLPHSTPLRQHKLTPLNITSTRGSDENCASGVTLDRLAPPNFVNRTPHSKVDLDAHLRKQTATLTKLRITDLNDSNEQLNIDDDDSGCEMEDDEEVGDALFLGGTLKTGRYSHISGVDMTAAGKREVEETMSPGGHVTKRRARSRLVTNDFMHDLRRSPSPSPFPTQHGVRKSNSTRGRISTNAIAFPATSRYRGRTSSNHSSSSSEAGSPVPRHRVSGIGNSNRPSLTKAVQDSALAPARQPLGRVDSATLFFGPSVPGSRSRATSNSAHLPPTIDQMGPLRPTLRPKLSNRHSYAGGAESDSWSVLQSRTALSPQSSPPSIPGDGSVCLTDDEDEAMLFEPTPLDSSFSLFVTEGSPSPRSKGANATVIPKKYKPRDSGIVVSSDEDEMAMSVDSTTSGYSSGAMPLASASDGSIYSDGDGLVTPGFGPEATSGWPETPVVIDDSLGGMGEPHSSQEDLAVDAFIMRTLAAAAKGPQEIKKIPGTPVKKIKNSFLSGDRPWQSAVARKVGLGHDYDGKFKGPPRKSLPAAFPPPGMKANKVQTDNSDSEDEPEESPSSRKEKYAGLGLGRPSLPVPKEGFARSRWLLRRSSSGAISSGSDSMSTVCTPTRSHTTKGRPSSRMQIHFSPSKNVMRMSPARSGSGSSTSSGMTINSPVHPISGAQRYPAPRPSVPTRRISEPSAQEQSGRYERDFIEVDEVGRGEFGKVIKVRSKTGDNGEVFAIKKSKRFEGAKHRLRLREEVETLQHLSHINGGNCHPNVLAFVDSWEEDESLFIRTELCELGNLARFLWEFGRAFPRLDEARVWKIIVDLSNGLRFIHDSGVIHLDLKPANIFVNGEGRFKIGDFGMASLWPRPSHQPSAGALTAGSFEREGDKLYLAPEVLQGQYGKAADVFSFGMTILETASNIVVPDQGEAWQRLRRENYEQVDLDDSPELFDLIRQMMRTEPSLRIDVHQIYSHPVVSRARANMERTYAAAKRHGTPVFAASPLASVSPGFLEEILDHRIGGAMDPGL